MTPKRLAHRSGHVHQSGPPRVYDFIAKSLSRTCDLESSNEWFCRVGEGLLCFFQSGVLFNEFLLAVPGKTDGQLDLVA